MIPAIDSLSLFMYIVFSIKVDNLFISGKKEKAQDSKIYVFPFVKNIYINICFSPPQFFQRPQIQPPRATIPNSSPSIRPGAQTPTAVYQANQHIMMVNHLPMPYPVPQGPQYCIPQVKYLSGLCGPAVEWGFTHILIRGSR